MNENLPLDELLLRGTGIGAEPPERTWQERMEFIPKKWYVDEEPPAYIIDTTCSDVIVTEGMGWKVQEKK